MFRTTTPAKTLPELGLKKDDNFRALSILVLINKQPSIYQIVNRKYLNGKFLI
jgi:hypothetical protein